jgi:dihydropteroate synthase
VIIKKKLLSLLNTTTPIIMGIVNLTDDSFYDGGYSLDALESQVADYVAHGVDIIDIGAESSRPGAQPISSDIEIQRIETGLKCLKKYPSVIISVDTYKSNVAEFALAHGAHIINDITGGESPALLATVAAYDAGLVLMHKQGVPATMQNAPSYDDPVADIKLYLSRQVALAKNAGVTTIIIDPGIGFGKTLAHNLAILTQLESFQTLGCPVLIGTSNKSFIGDLTGASVNDRLPGSIASVLMAYQKGAQLFRVHHVKETIQAMDVFRALR